MDSVRVMVTSGDKVTIDVVLDLDRAQAFFPWLCRTHSALAGSAATKSVCYPHPFEHLPRALDAARQASILGEFTAWFDAKFLTGWRPF